MLGSEPSLGQAPSGKRGSRRLAGIAFADVVGYSILMATDERRTHARWMWTLDEIVRPQAARHGGTVIKLTGDGVLAEFPSALDAAEWAQDVQRGCAAAQHEGNGLAEPIALRIAVHVGDVLTGDGDIYGDAVNLAARLQEHAPPGGVVLSEAAYDLLRGALGAQARDLGLLHLKNFERPVRAYALDPAVPALAVPVPPAQGPLPSIAVLPFLNVGGDPGDEYFSDGVVEDIVVSLAALHELMVISRGPTLFYRGRQPDPRDVGRALGVRYVLTGAVRRHADRVRVSAQLCDALTGANLWGERTEAPIGGLFEVQDRIVGRIVAGIAPQVRAAELQRALRKRPEVFTSYDCTLRALDLINSLNRKSFLQARGFLEQAMAEDPMFAMPVAWAARWHSVHVGQRWPAKPEADASRAAALAAHAIELDPQNALALATYGHVRSFLFHESESAMVYFDRALAACPNLSLAWILSSATLSYLGRGKEAVSRAEHGLRLSPFDQNLYSYYMFLGLAHYADGAYEEALKWARMSASENPAYTATLRLLIATLAALGRTDEARDVGARLLRREPNFRVAAYARTRQPFRCPEIRESYLSHLRKAGLPE